MKFCQLLTFPEEHLRSFHLARPHLQDAPFKLHASELMQEAVDASSLWMPALADAGHEVQFIVANDAVSQQRWAEEKLAPGRLASGPDWVEEIVIEQLRKFKVDVLCITDPARFDARFLARLKVRPRWVVGWCAEPHIDDVNLQGVDLVLSPHQSCVRAAWKQGALQARLFPAGFPRSIAEAVFQEPESLDVVYAGSWSSDKRRGREVAQVLAAASQRQEGGFRLGLHLGLTGVDDMPKEVRAVSKPLQYGLARFRTLASTRIVVTEVPEEQSGSIIPPGLHEGTGLGACTFVEDSPGVASLFKPGSEVVTYRGEADLLAKIDTYLADDKNRMKIARAGQERCLTEHAMEARMKSLVSLLEKPGNSIANTLRRRWHQLRP